MFSSINHHLPPWTIINHGFGSPVRRFTFECGGNCWRATRNHGAGNLELNVSTQLGESATVLTQLGGSELPGTELSYLEPWCLRLLKKQQAAGRSDNTQATMARATQWQQVPASTASNMQDSTYISLSWTAINHPVGKQCKAGLRWVYPIRMNGLPKFGKFWKIGRHP